jgi:hypothetical protein
MKKLLMQFLTLYHICFDLLRVVKNAFHPDTTREIKISSPELAILANGPSLQYSLDNDVAKLPKADIMCINDFAITGHYENLKPKYYLFLDPCYVLPNVYKALEESRKKVFESIATKTTWKMYLLFPGSTKDSEHVNALIRNNSNLEIIFFNQRHIDCHEKLSHLLYSKRKGMPTPQNTLHACIFVGINAGYKKIYLFGADHSWHETIALNKDNMLCIKKGYHFYDQEEQELIPNYKDAEKGTAFTMPEFMIAMAKTFEGYFKLQKYADAKGCCLLNASHKTYIDAIKRIQL